MDNSSFENKYWEEVLYELDREDDNSARRYRRYNISLEAIGENILDTLLPTNDLTDEVYNEFELTMEFIDCIEDEKLYKALKKLKPVERKMIIYRFDENLKTIDIANRLGKGVSTVSERIQRILKKLTENINKE